MSPVVTGSSLVLLEKALSSAPDSGLRGFPSSRREWCVFLSLYYGSLERNPGSAHYNPDLVTVALLSPPTPGAFPFPGTLFLFLFTALGGECPRPAETCPAHSASGCLPHNSSCQAALDRLCTASRPACSQTRAELDLGGRCTAVSDPTLGSDRFRYK